MKSVWIISIANPPIPLTFVLQHNAELMTEAVRVSPLSVTRCDGACTQGADLSEAHAVAGLVTKVAWALLCKDIPRVTGFVETDASQIISPAKFVYIYIVAMQTFSFNAH